MSNAERMSAAVDRWIEEAEAMPNGGVEALKRRAKWMDDQFTALEHAVIRDRRVPAHLEGVSAVALLAAHGKLMVGMRRLEEGR